MGSSQTSSSFVLCRFPHSGDYIVATGESRVIALHVSPDQSGKGEELEISITEGEHETGIHAKGSFISEYGL
jgi:hypothetical protein